MSSTAPWLALAVDWDESEMWDSLPQYGIADESTMGERLAWVCLLCDAKRKGRGGKVSVRKSVFQKHHRLTGRAVEGMLHRAQKCGAVEVNGDFITLCNWRTYQEKTGGKKMPQSTESPESALPRTKDQGPTTHHPSPPPNPLNPSAPDPEPLDAEWLAVVADLGRAGVGRAEEACLGARSRGCSAHDVRFVLNQFNAKPGAWGAGLLKSIVECHHPDKKVSWPRENESYVKKELQKKRAAETAKQTAKRAEKTSISDEEIAKRAEVFKSALLPSRSEVPDA